MRMRTSTIVGGLIVLVAAGLAAGWLSLRAGSEYRTIGARYAAEVGPPLEEAVVNGEWQKVVDQLPDVSPKEGSPVLRLLKGHALLALNRNNDSLCLFVHTLSDPDLKQWEEYTKYLAWKHGQKAVAHYLRGDALARRQQWDLALASLDRALSRQPRYALALNARGMVHAGAGRWDAAIVDLDEATKSAPSLADGWCNRGAVSVQRQSGTQGAVEWFSRALQVSPGFALALNGRGCSYFASGDWDKARVDFTQARRATKCLPIAADNLVSLSRAQLELVKSYAETLARNPGMSMNRTVELDNLNTSIGQNMRQIDSVRGAQWRVDNLWRPAWNLARDLDVPLADAMLQHLDNRTNINVRTIDALSHDISGRQGGVSTDMRRAYIDDGHWPVATWPGLAYYVRPMTG